MLLPQRKRAELVVLQVARLSSQANSIDALHHVAQVYELTFPSTRPQLSVCIGQRYANKCRNHYPSVPTWRVDELQESRAERDFSEVATRRQRVVGSGKKLEKLSRTDVLASGATVR